MYVMTGYEELGRQAREHKDKGYDCVTFRDLIDMQRASRGYKYYRPDLDDVTHARLRPLQVLQPAGLEGIVLVGAVVSRIRRIVSVLLVLTSGQMMW